MFYLESNLKLGIVLFLALDKTMNISKIKYRNVGKFIFSKSGVLELQ